MALTLQLHIAITKLPILPIGILISGFFVVVVIVFCFVLFFPSSFLLGMPQEWRVDLESLGNEIDWVVLYEIPK